VTFAYRYDQNIVQPALAAIRQSPDRVVWVADDGTGDFLLLSTALASISDASASNPYVVRIAPGEYTETATVALKTYVDVEGSGQGITTITCECAGADFDASSATVSAGDVVAEIRHLTINNTGGDTVSIGVGTEDVVDGSVSMSNVTATGTGGTNSNYGVRNESSSPSMTNVTATGTGGTYSYGVYNRSSSSPSMMNVTATATGGTNNYGVYNWSSSSSMTNVTATGTGGTYSYGVWNDSSSPSMTNVTATATGGTNNYGVYNWSSSSPSVRSSSITGDDDSIYNSGSSSAQVADTMLDGPVAAGGGLTCVGAYDETFAAFDSSCAVIP
jgi:hypothetical protein